MKQKAVIMDMDGTLVDVSSLRHLIASSLKSKNFDEFHRQSINCPPIDWVANAAREAHKEGLKILVVTARQDTYRDVTSLWLSMHSIPSDRIVMRITGDHRPDHEVKADMLAQLDGVYQIVKAFDDRPSVVKLWESRGIPTITVPGWID